MFDYGKLYTILNETTVQLRKGDIFQGTPSLVEQAKNGIGEDGLEGGGVLEIFAMPHVSEAPNLKAVDMQLLTIGVDVEKAEARRDEFMELLDSYPEPDQLSGGPSYISVGAVIGDQGAAFQMLALGEVLGIWDVITPAKLGATGAVANQMAGSGYIMCTGYQSKVPA